MTAGNFEFGRATAGLVLAGGQSRRMGRDKAGVVLDGRSLLDHAQALLALTLPGAPVAVSWNGAPIADVITLPDTLPDHPGPLAGVLAGLIWAEGLGCDWLLTVPVDAPFLPADTYPRLRAAALPGRPVLAEAGGRLHPTVALWPVTLRQDLEVALRSGERRVAKWADAAGAVVVDFPEPGAFANLNTPEDLAHAQGSRWE